MQQPLQNFFNVSGVDSNPGATIVFVWCRDKNTDKHVLVGSGHVVGEFGCGRPPGVPIGQFSITFPLPAGCSVADVFLTNDHESDGHLSTFVITACATGGVLSSVEANSFGKRAANAGSTPASLNHSPMMAHSRR
jgi:hypothetical protein